MRERMLRGELDIADDAEFGRVQELPAEFEYGAIGIGDGTFVNVGAVMLDISPIPGSHRSTNPLT